MGSAGASRRSNDKVVPIPGSNQPIQIEELRVAKGCSLIFEYSRTNKNGMPIIGISPRYEKEHEKSYRTKKPGSGKGPTLSLLKNKLLISEIEGFLSSINEHIHGNEIPVSTSFTYGSSKLTLRKHVVFRKKAPYAIYHFLTGYDATSQSAFNIGINKMTLNKIAKILGEIAKKHTIIPVLMAIGEGSKQHKASGTMIIESGSIRIITSDERATNINLNHTTLETLLFACELHQTKTQALNTPTLISGHTLKKGSISFYRNKLLITININERLSRLLTSMFPANSF